MHHKMPAVCSCPQNIYTGFGITYWSPEAMLEAVSDPMCFPALGETKFSHQMDNAAGANGRPRGEGSHFKQVHKYLVDFMYIVKLLETAAKCSVVKEAFDITFMSEYYPYWKNEVWGATKHAEILLMNPITQIACSFVGAFRTLTRDADDPLFFCGQSAKDSIIPSGYAEANGAGIASGNQSVFDKIPYMQARNFEDMLTITKIAQCFPVPVGITFPAMFRYDQFLPHKLSAGEVKTGVSHVVWGTGFAGKPAAMPVPGKTDSAKVVWKARQCCVGI